MAESKSGCLVCGGDLTSGRVPERTVCALCGQPAASAIRCAAGHAVCEGCQASVARDVVERVCRATESRDPIEIALSLMRHPAVKLHGPEHHFLVPAALLAAYANTRGEPRRREQLVAEARAAVDRAPGRGGCGCDLASGRSAAHGAGVFAAVAAGALDGAAGAAQRAELAQALTKASVALVEQIGKRAAGCCKRTTFLAILQAAHFARERLDADLRAKGPACEWFNKNPACIRGACPFYRPAAA